MGLFSWQLKRQICPSKAALITQILGSWELLHSTRVTHPHRLPQIFVIRIWRWKCGWQQELLFLLNIVSISRRASVTAMIVQLYFDRQRRVFGILLTRSPHSYWVVGLPYLTYSPPIIVTVDHGVNGNASLLSNIKLIIMPIWISVLTFPGSKGSSWNEHSRPPRCFWGEKGNWF